MKLAIYCQASPTVGLGHYYRALALKETALKSGFPVALCCQADMPDIDYSEPAEIEAALSAADLVVNDTHHDDAFTKAVPLSRQIILNPDDLRSCYLAWPQNEPELIILRPSLLEQTGVMGEQTLVWGGSYDPLNLLPYYSQHGPQPANLFVNGGLTPAHLATCRDAVISFGMVAWELAYFGKSIHAFSLTKGHLRGALRLQMMGLLAAWPSVGLPAPNLFKLFLTRPFTPRPTWRPDGLGAKRLLKKLGVL